VGRLTHKYLVFLMVFSRKLPKDDREWFNQEIWGWSLLTFQKSSCNYIPASTDMCQVQPSINGHTAHTVEQSSFQITICIIHVRLFSFHIFFFFFECSINVQMLHCLYIITFYKFHKGKSCIGTYKRCNNLYHRYNIKKKKSLFF
jgi:hypothetical protein